jgi:hypothetical protein
MAVFWVVVPCSVTEFIEVQQTPTLHGATTQKTAIFVLAAVRTWNLTTQQFLIFVRTLQLCRLCHSFEFSIKISVLVKSRVVFCIYITWKPLRIVCVDFYRKKTFVCLEWRLSVWTYGQPEKQNSFPLFLLYNLRPQNFLHAWKRRVNREITTYSSDVRRQQFN